MSQKNSESLVYTNNQLSYSGIKDVDATTDTGEDISIEEFVLNHPLAPVRLYNGIRYAAQNGQLPYRTINEYMAAGPERIDRMLKLRHLGRKSIADLESLITNANNHPKSHSVNTFISSNSRLIAPEFEISPYDFLVGQERVSVRLLNAVREATQEGAFPYLTIAEYARDGNERVDRMLKLPNIGRKSANEFERLVCNAIANGSIEPSPACPSKEVDTAIFDISLYDFLVLQGNVSERLRNAIRAATHELTCPYSTLGEYLSDGLERFERLRKIPNLGRASADEFEALARAAIASGSVEPPLQVSFDSSGFPELGALMTKMFGSLDEREFDILIGRIKSGHTLEVVSRTLGVTRERVRQIEQKALTRLTKVFARSLDKAVMAIHMQLSSQGIKECTLTELAALGNCDTTTCKILFSFIKKLELIASHLLELSDDHVILPGEFSPRENWNNAVDGALMEARWPLELNEFYSLLPNIPRHYIEHRLIERHHAQITQGIFLVEPRISNSEMCIQALIYAKGPLHINEIQAEIFKRFGKDLTESHINSIVGNHKEVTITAPGTYARYADIPYSAELIQTIRDKVFHELTHRQVFLSSKVLFERLFAGQSDAYPQSFNHYFILGFVKDDQRFVTKRGNMVGLIYFDIDAVFISLEEEVREIVVEQGPITIPAIIERLSETRRLCNESGVRLILTQTPEIICVGKRTYDSLHRFFHNREEYDSLTLALKIALLSGSKGLYALTDDMARVGIRKGTFHVIESVLNASEEVIKIDQAYRLKDCDQVLARYQELALLSLHAGGRQELLRNATQEFGKETAEKLIKYDSRFIGKELGSAPNDSGTELKSILSEFDF